MSVAGLRLGLLLTTLVTSLHAVAATRYWALTDVKFSDGAIATGYLSYDDATQKITNWNVRVTPGPAQAPGKPPFLGFTYTAGNSESFVGPFSSFRPGQYFSLDSTPAGSPLGFYRSLIIIPLVQPDASVAVVPLGSASYEGFFADTPVTARGISGTLVRMPLSPPVTVIQVDEFYNAVLDHYFITADNAEKQDLDASVHLGWVRTGESFKAYAPGSDIGGSVDPTCRYYGNPLQGLDSHFYSADAAECLIVYLRYRSDWLFESDNVFQIHLPDTTTGACPNSTIPVYRLWNQRVDSNHRFTTRQAIKAEMVATGYVAEGYGPDAVAMCAIQ